jgi:hypothetical protein
MHAPGQEQKTLTAEIAEFAEEKLAERRRK